MYHQYTTTTLFNVIVLVEKKKELYQNPCYKPTYNDCGYYNYYYDGTVGFSKVPHNVEINIIESIIKQL